MAQLSLITVIDVLESQYGAPEPPLVTRAFDIILFENVAYLVDDERRRQVWDRFRREIGARPDAILAAPLGVTANVIKDGGMHPPRRAAKLRDAARIAQEEFAGDLDGALKLPVAKARRALKRFPGVGDPGADKILLLTRTQPVLALDSNGLRALVRLGFCQESSNYAATYRAVQAAIDEDLRDSDLASDFGWLIAANQLLRRHGQTLCKNTKPLCSRCPLAASCPAAEL